MDDGVIRPNVLSENGAEGIRGLGRRRKIDLNARKGRVEALGHGIIDIHAERQHGNPSAPGAYPAELAKRGKLRGVVNLLIACGAGPDVKRHGRRRVPLDIEQIIRYDNANAECRDRAKQLGKQDARQHPAGMPWFQMEMHKVSSIFVANSSTFFCVS